MGLRQLIIDSWSWLNYKPVFSDERGMPDRRKFADARAMWVPAEDERRLAAYKLLTAYDSNQAAELTAHEHDHEARDRREFGDPSMYIETLLSHVLGREQHITVPGAEHDEADTQDASAAMAERVQELLRDWADDELLPMRMQQAERKAVGLGDAVYRLAWDPAKKRPTLRVTDPGFYFPVLPEEGDAGEYPERVHFAWELPADDKRGTKARLRRITFELAPIRPATVPGLDSNGRPVRAFLTADVPEDGTDPGPVLIPADTLDPNTGSITRLYPWNDEPTTLTCYLTDATWLLSDLTGPMDIDTVPMAKAVFATRSDGEVLDHLDLMVDFMPVVHVPNTVPAAEEHWGQSSLAKVLQGFDELSAADTDAARASATTGMPIVALSGKYSGGRNGQTLRVTPGIVFEMGEGGRMDSLNTAPQLAELRNQRKDLQDRTANVARLPAVAMGTLDPTKVPSGYALQLSLGPLDSLVGSMRLARAHKYQLLLKFVQRLFLAGQHPDWAGVTVQPAVMTFGPYTPTDRAAVLEQVVAGVGGGVLSLETAIRMLKDAGFPIDDAAKEIQQIQARQFEQARALADATGDTGAVGDFLGRDLNPDPVAPTPILPPLPGQPAEDPNNPAPGNAPTSANPAVQPTGGKGS